MGETKSLYLLLKESWDFFAERWILFFKIALFIWSPVFFVTSFFWAFLFGTYNILKNNKELLFSPKVIASAGIIVIFLACILAIAVAIHQIIKTKLTDILLAKKGEQYYLNFSGLLKDSLPYIWPLGVAETLKYLIVSIGWLFPVLILSLLMESSGTYYLLYERIIKEIIANGFLSMTLLESPEKIKLIILFFGVSLLGLLFAVWFAFVSFEVILKNRRGREALVNSRNIIRYSIGKFIGNTLAMFILLIFINISISGYSQLIVLSFGSEAVIGFANIISTVSSNIFNIWGSVFSFMLYRELDKKYHEKNNQIPNTDNQ